MAYMQCGDRWGSLSIDRGHRGGSAERSWRHSGVADTTSQSVEDIETALKTINDPQIDVAWVTQARRELTGVWEAMTRSRDKLANNLAKLSAIDDRKSEVKKHLAREHRKLTETDDTEIQQDIQDRMEKLKGDSPTSSLKGRRGSKPSV